MQIDFVEWENGREVRVVFWGQQGIAVKQVVGGELVRAFDEGRSSVVIFTLGHSCAPLTECLPKPGERQTISFRLEPAARHPPRIICLPATPPLPPPSLLGPGDASEPEHSGALRGMAADQQRIVRADSSCELGGVATIQSSSELPSGQTAARVVVQLGLRDDRAAEVSIGVRGALLSVAEVMGASIKPPEVMPELGLVLLHFILPPRKREMVFTLKGQIGLHLSRMACSVTSAERATLSPHSGPSSPPTPSPSSFAPSSASDLVLACLLFALAALLAIGLLLRHGEMLLACVHQFLVKKRDLEPAHDGGAQEQAGMLWARSSCTDLEDNESGTAIKGKQRIRVPCSEMHADHLEESSPDQGVFARGFRRPGRKVLEMETVVVTNHQECANIGATEVAHDDQTVRCRPTI